MYMHRYHTIFLILGAGVAGLSAIGTAKSVSTYIHTYIHTYMSFSFIVYLLNLYSPFQMGAQAYAYDVRAVVQEQVESLGGIFLRYIHTYIHTWNVLSTVILLWQMPS